MNIVLGTDHRGFAHKEFLKKHTTLAGAAISWIDVGADNDLRSDYPIFATKACCMLQKGEAEKAILLCGSGVGMAIAANRYEGIYAALVWNSAIATLSVEDDGANVLVIPADFVDTAELVAIVEAWLTAQFKEGRYRRRKDEVDRLGGVRC
jgi:ribose 5-phosphate isomerase B